MWKITKCVVGTSETTSRKREEEVWKALGEEEREKAEAWKTTTGGSAS